MLCTGETAFWVQGIGLRLPPGQTKFIGHCAHGPPLKPLNPGRHTQSVISEDPVGAKEPVGHVLERPLKQTSPSAHCVQVAESRVNLKPGLHVQALESLEPTGEVKFAGHVTISSPFPPGQYESALQIGHGLVPDLEPLPKYPGAQRH